MRRPFAAIAALALALTLAGPAAADTAPTMQLGPGQACTFGLNVYVGAGGPSHELELHNGVALSAGRGNAMVFENATTLATFETPATGSVSRTLSNQDGSYTKTMMGANVLIMFPTDTPAGPSTTLYVGRVTFTSDALGNYTFLSSTGRSVDICAALE